MDNPAFVNLTVNGDPAQVADAVATLFGRQTGFRAPSENVPNPATVSLGTSTVKVSVEPGDSVARLFGKAGDRLGMEAGRALTFQAGGRVIDGNALAQVGAEYVAVPNHDPKG